MKVAIAADNGNVAQHFGKCQEYVIFDVVDGQVDNMTPIKSPGHRPNFLPQYLKDNFNIEYVIAGGMGQKALALFAQNNIKPIIGISGEVKQVADDFVKGKLVSGASTCGHSQGKPHQCGGGCC